MVLELTVECPNCHQVAEIYLSTNAYVVILNCPSCCSPIMYVDQKIFLLTPNQLDAIKRKVKNSSTINLLRKMITPEREHLPVKKSALMNKNSEREGRPPYFAEIPLNAASSLKESGKVHICYDDITNLKIDLALCRDVLEFVDKI